jgi:hypothetical protein
MEKAYTPTPEKVLDSHLRVLGRLLNLIYVRFLQT